MMSSCTSAAAWKTSSAAAAATTRPGGGAGAVRAASADGPPARDAEPPAEALAAGQSSRRGLDEKPRFGAEIGRCGSLSREEVVQTLGNRFDRVRRG